MENLIELEEILTFLGIEFIDYKGHRTSDGHKTAKTEGQIQAFFGRDNIQTTGMFIEDIARSKMFDLRNDWNWLMFTIDHIKAVSCEEYHLLDEIDDALICVEIEAVYNAVVKFVKWYNENQK